MCLSVFYFFFFSSRRRHTIWPRDWSSDVCSSDLSAPRLTGFTGVPTYPYDPELVVTGIWTARPAMVTVGAALPWLEHELPSPGVATVEIGDREIGRAHV